MPAVTEAMIYTSMRHQINNAGLQMHRSQEQATTGLRVSRPEQDPVAAERSSLLTESLSAIEGMRVAAQGAAACLNHTDHVLRVVQSCMLVAEEAAISAGAKAGSMYPEQLNALSLNVQAAHDEILALSNTQHDGLYIFAGFGGVVPFVGDGTYAGDDQIRLVEISPSVFVGANLPGSQVFNASATGGENVLEVLQTLATALSLDDTATIDQCIEDVQKSIVQIAQAHAHVGVMLRQIENSVQVRENTSVLLRDQRSQVIEAEAADSYSELARAQSAYEAAITESARILQQLNGGLLR